jgi:hypothetical protein
MGLEKYHEKHISESINKLKIRDSIKDELGT